MDVLNITYINVNKLSHLSDCDIIYILFGILSYHHCFIIIDNIKKSSKQTIAQNETTLIFSADLSTKNRLRDDL